MRILLNRFNLFIIAMFLLVFCKNVNAQTYNITGNVNSSTLACATFTGYNVISIGNGSTTSNLIMDADLDLRLCSLEPLQVFVNNATIDFTTANKRLYLPEGSSISFINGGTLNPAGGNGGGCTGNDRIYIGTALLAACQGSPGVLGFDDIIDFGGTGATASNSPVCVGNSINLSATPPPNGGPLTYTWYEPSVSASTSVGTGQSISIASATSGTHIYQVHMFSASLNNTMIANATVVVNSGATNATPTVNLTQPTCTLTTGTITITAPTGSGMKYSIDGLTYTNTTGVFTSVSAGTYDVTAKNSSGCISNATSVTINVQPATPSAPTITAGGSTTFCSGGGVTLTSSAGTSYLWSTGATTQSISAISSGSYTVQVTNASGCQSSSSIAATVTVYSLPVITTQPITQLDCEGASVDFTAVATGTGLTYTWQRKKPTDASFITIPVEGNISYPSVGKIKIDNVGSSQSPSGTLYQVVVTNSDGCSVTSSAATLLVNEIIGVTGSTTITQCYGTGYSYTVTTSTPSPGYVVSYQWKSSVTSGVWNNVVDGIHFSGATTATLNIINGTPTESAEYRVYVVFHSSGADCNVDSSTRSRAITFLPQLTAPEVSLTQPTCTLSTGTITITAVAGETYSFDGGAFLSTLVYSGLAQGSSHTVYAKNASGCISLVTNSTIKNATNIWNGSAWSNGTLPISTENIEFTGNYSNSSDISGCSCTVNTGINVTIKSGRNLIITNEVSVLGTGTLTFENTASLMQTNNVPNSGNINYVRTTNTAVLSTDYTYWSAPVSPQTIGDFSPETQEGMMYSYDSSIDDWKQEYLSTSMVAGLGYIVRGPEPSPVPTPPSPYMATFVGVPHNGDYSIPAIADKSYLLGNPYPSALDADTFLNANSNVLDGTLYFWTHNTGIGTNVSNPGTGVYAYSGDDYATYNQTGGTAAAPSGGSVPNGKIAAGQGFFASTKTSISGTEIVYSNSMRVGVGGITGTNSQFFKTRNPKEKVVSPIKKNRVWLNLTNTQGAFKQTLVGYITDATNGYDSRFDGESFDGNEFVDFYSINDDKNLTIQGRALPFDGNDEVPLGFRTTISGAFTINIDQADGVLANQPVFIEDKLTNTISDLKSGNYTFTTVAGTFNDRFVLRYKDNTSDKILSVDETEANDGIIVLYSNNYKTLIIRNNMSDTIVNSVTLFNMLGQKITHWDIKEREQTSIQIPIKNVNPEIYIVKVKTTKGETSKRIIIR